MSKIFNNTTSLNELLEAIQNKAAGNGNGTGEDITAEVSENTTRLAELVSAVDALETLVASKASPEGVDTSDATATSSDLLSGKTAYVDGEKITGTIETKTSSNLTASGAIVTVPAGYYASQATKSVSTAAQATPSITVNSAGLITAKVTQSAGYVSSGTKSNTKQLTTKAATTYTPGTTNQTISSATYLTGTQTILGDSNLVASNIKSGTSIFGVTGSYEGSGDSITYEEYAGEFVGDAEIVAEGYKVTFGIVNSAPGFNFYSLDNGITWLDFDTLVGSESTITTVEYIMENVTTIKFKVISTATSGWSGWIKCNISPMIFSIAGENDEVIETDNYILTEDINAVTVTRNLWD